MGDWSAVYLHDDLGAAPALAGAGFAAFSLAMAVGRFSGDHLAARLGPARLLRLSGGLAAVGLAAALVMDRAAAAIAGASLVGLGLANSVPVLFGAAGRMPGTPGRGGPCRGGDDRLQRIPGRAAGDRPRGGCGRPSDRARSRGAGVRRHRDRGGPREPGRHARACAGGPDAPARVRTRQYARTREDPAGEIGPVPRVERV